MPDTWVSVCGSYLRFKDIYVHVKASDRDTNIIHFDETAGQWVQGPKSYFEHKIAMHASRMLIELLGMQPVPKQLLSGCFVSSGLKYMDVSMYNPRFHNELNGAGTMEFVKFEDAVLRRSDKQLVPPSPAQRISISTGYPYPGDELHALQEKLTAKDMDMHATFAKVKAEHAKGHAELGNDLEAELCGIASIVEALQRTYDLVEERAMNEQLTRIKARSDERNRARNRGWKIQRYRDLETARHTGRASQSGAGRETDL